MKKNRLLIPLVLCASLLHSQEVPELLKGIWTNSDRYVVFDTGYSKEQGSIPQIVLKAFYRWYDDRAAEPLDYTKENPRDRNNTTRKSAPEEIYIKYTPLTDQLFPENQGAPVTQDDGDTMYAEELPSGAWNLEITFHHHKETFNIPVAVFGGELYLNFIIKTEDSDNIEFSPLLEGTVMQAENILTGFWQHYGKSNGILISPTRNSKELLSFYMTDNAVYHIRYWRTDMDYDSEKMAVFSDGEEIHHVPKHLRVAGETFTCVNGRGSKIRNIEKGDKFPLDFKTNRVLVEKHVDETTYRVRTSTLCVLGEPYLKKTDGTMSLEEIIREDSKRHPPEPEPLFPPHGILDFDWSIIEDPPSDWKRRMLDLGK